MTRSLAILILMTSPSLAGWCDPTRDECWTRPEPPAARPQVRAWVKHQAPPARIIIKKEVVIKHDPMTARCRPYVAAIGDSAKSEAAAKLEAQKSWKGTVQFEYGNKFLDIQNADNLEYQCGPSSVPKFGGLIENAVGKYLPIESITCRLSAQPCASPVQRDLDK